MVPPVDSFAEFPAEVPVRSPLAPNPMPVRATITRPPPRLPREWWDSERLLGTRGEIKIRHHGEIYSLRLTRLGKLILTK